eukprot:3538665-Prymnesium_polylepis.1
MRDATAVPVCMRHHATRCAALRPAQATPRRPWEGPTLLHPLFDPTCTARLLLAAPCPWQRSFVIALPIRPPDDDLVDSSVAPLL